jgi:hypothetical protein
VNDHKRRFDPFATPSAMTAICALRSCTTSRSAAHHATGIAITVEAFEAIARTLPLGSVAVAAEANERGERYVWLPPNAVDRLRAMRGPGEDYSAVILRITGREERA